MRWKWLETWCIFTADIKWLHRQFLLNTVNCEVDTVPPFTVHRVESTAEKWQRMCGASIKQTFPLQENRRNILSLVEVELGLRVKSFCLLVWCTVICSTGALTSQWPFYNVTVMSSCQCVRKQLRVSTWCQCIYAVKLWSEKAQTKSGFCLLEWVQLRSEVSQKLKSGPLRRV